MAQMQQKLGFSGDAARSFVMAVESAKRIVFYDGKKGRVLRDIATLQANAGLSDAAAATVDAMPQILAMMSLGVTMF